ncbi:lysophospholipid acyltransferase family protein [Pseudorhodoplanes sp.]|uniref:lysophospholipid acyltransferase family protein n=1 Tax=Pseudorhodoplanes sp. TaxID=1934341 RepID=UPI00391B496A
MPPPAWRWPLPARGFGDRVLLRGLAALADRQVIAISGLHHIDPRHDPLIVAINHSTRTEAILVPALLMRHRGGRIVHFLADWNFRLIPGIGLLYRRAQTISVMRKPARPKALTLLKPLFANPISALEQARRKLLAGHAIGVFPEGTVNRDPQTLLPGRRGTAYLSLATGAPVVPVGIRFPEAMLNRPIPDTARMTVTIGAAMHPPTRADRPTRAETRDWHAAIMSEIGRLSAKDWCNR